MKAKLLVACILKARILICSDVILEHVNRLPMTPQVILRSFIFSMSGCTKVIGRVRYLDCRFILTSIFFPSIMVSSNPLVECTKLADSPSKTHYSVTMQLMRVVGPSV